MRKLIIFYLISTNSIKDQIYIVHQQTNGNNSNRTIRKIILPIKSLENFHSTSQRSNDQIPNIIKPKKTITPTKPAETFYNKSQRINKNIANEQAQKQISFFLAPCTPYINANEKKNSQRKAIIPVTSSININQKSKNNTSNITEQTKAVKRPIDTIKSNENSANERAQKQIGTFLIPCASSITISVKSNDNTHNETKQQIVPDLEKLEKKQEGMKFLRADLGPIATSKYLSNQKSNKYITTFSSQKYEIKNNNTTNNQNNKESNQQFYPLQYPMFLTTANDHSLNSNHSSCSDSNNNFSPSHNQKSFHSMLHSSNNQSNCSCLEITPYQSIIKKDNKNSIKQKINEKRKRGQK